MRRWTLLVPWLAVATASADTIGVQFTDPSALAGWTTRGISHQLRGGELLVDDVSMFENPISLDAHGWTVEIRFAIDQKTTLATPGVEIVDGRQKVMLARGPGYVKLDDQQVPLPNDDLAHTYRIEVSAGRHRLLVDGKLLVDHDGALDGFGVRSMPGVRFGVVGRAGPGRDPVRFTSIVIDTAPKNLPASEHELPALVVLGPWLQRLDELAPERKGAFAKLKFREDARACVAFAIVAASATPRPARYRKREVAQWLAKAEPKPPEPSAPPIDPYARDNRRHPLPQCDPAGPCDCGQPCGDDDDATPVPLEAMRLVAQSFDDAVALDRAAETILRVANSSTFTPGTVGRYATRKGGRRTVAPPPVMLDWRWLQATLANLVKHPRACE